MSYHTGDVYTPVRGAVYNSNWINISLATAVTMIKIVSVYRLSADRFVRDQRFPLRLLEAGAALWVQYLAFKRQVYGKTYNYDLFKRRRDQQPTTHSICRIEGSTLK